ncbi:MAG: response regulator transcription factor [Elusimicrobia bacterium]|nr:response regulator transcription factor [Elusimicrobiota bacterium]
MVYQPLKILIVEDDIETIKFLNSLLKTQNYKVVCCDNANNALEWLKTNLADLIILDIDLPGLSGIQCCKLIKENSVTSSLPVIMLTAAGDEQHKVEGLKTGADDYVVKPFSVKELLARIEAVLRRYKYEGKIDKKIIFKKITMDFDRGEVIVDGKKIYLSPKEYSLLAMFLRRPGYIFTYSSIADEVWGINAIATRDTIKGAIYRLKEKLGKYADYIQPVIGLGYKWHEEINNQKQ